MENLSIILLGCGIGATLLAVLFLGVSVKGSKGVSPAIVSLSIMGFLTIFAGIALMVPGVKSAVMGEGPRAVVAEDKQESDLNAVAEDTSSETALHTEEETASPEETDDAGAGEETEPQKITRKLVEQEMAKQEGLASWKIVQNAITSDKVVNNIADYDKPVGDKRVVWVDGTVEATTSEKGNTANVGFTLELYQMVGDTEWYIDEHWGVLRALVVTEKPEVDESQFDLSDSAELPFGDDE
ncbi:hypothetical protein [Thalassobacillus hwangdonensis]|uniref:Tim44-like domain-containing protein n=1 Tax=Thalassobacillus hwangdonensis TaxID=546108 RepID=A0ABW3L376_9BACI